MDATFREVAEAFPAARPALERSPAARAGKRWSLAQIGVAGAAITTEAARAAGAQTAPAIPACPCRSTGNDLLLLLLGLLAVTAWEAAMHGMFLAMPPAPGNDGVTYADTIPYAWYKMQSVQLWGWVLVGALALAAGVLRTGLTGGPRGPLATAARVFMLISLPAMLATAFFGSMASPLERSWPAVAGQACLLVAGVLLTLDLLMLLRGRPMDAASLLLVLAAQWMLVWLAASVSMQWQFRESPMWDADAVTLMTLLPALGMAVHLAMAVCARVLPGALGLRIIRHRALLLAILFFEGAMVALLMWPGLLARLGPAAGAMLALRTFLFCAGVTGSLVLFATAFDFLRGGPRIALSAGNEGALTIRVAFAWLAIAALLAAGEFAWRFLPDSAGSGVSPSYAGLYRHMLTAGFAGTLVFGLAARLMGMCVPAPLRSAGLGTLACAMWTGGVAAHAMAECSVMLGELRVLWVLALAAGMELAAVAMLGLLVFRGLRLARRAGGAINGATPLDALINARPRAELALESAGVGLLKDATRVPPVPLGAVALAWGWGVGELVEVVERAK